MLIFYADDDSLARELVEQSLRAVGHTTFAFDSGSTTAVTQELKELRRQWGQPDIFVLDGHNILRDAAGNDVYDMRPLNMIAWLRYNGFGDCRFILYSNDDTLVAQVRQMPSWNFYAAVPKAGSEGGIARLLAVIGQATP